jgi:putative phosphoesterase
MTRIGLLSDTHAYWDDKYYKYFDSCDEIWHAGDLGTDEIADKFEAFKTFRAVAGNIDGASIRQRYPLHNRFMCERVSVWLTHIGGYPGRYAPNVKPEIFTNPPRLFVCGHSHILKVTFDRKLNMLCMNPGAAGRYGIQKVRTLLRFNIDDDQIKDLEVIEIGQSSGG